MNIGISYNANTIRIARDAVPVCRAKLGKFLGALALFKSVYLVAVIGAVWLWPVRESGDMFRSARQSWTADGHLSFGSHFTSWDAEHYLRLSEDGYKAGESVCAFYPLWPLLMRWASPLAGGNHIIAAMMMSNLLSLAGFVIFARSVSKRFGRPTAWLALALLLFFPGALFFQFIYSESLFFLLLMVLLYGLDEDRWSVAFFAAALLPLTRAVGILCVPPLLVFLLMRWPPRVCAHWIGLQKEGGDCYPGSQTKGCETRPIPRGAPYWLLTAPFLGWSAYFYLMWYWTGNALEGFEAQKHWNVQSIGNFIDLPKFVIGFCSPTTWHQFIGSTLDRCVFIFMMCWLPAVWRLDKVWFVWTLALGLLPALSGTFCSYTRFAAVAFPIFVAMGVFLSKPGRHLARCLVLTTFCVLHILLVYRFLTYRWAG